MLLCDMGIYSSQWLVEAVTVRYRITELKKTTCHSLSLIFEGEGSAVLTVATLSMTRK